MKKFTLAFSPCPNDTFMMYAIVHQTIDLRGFQFETQLHDIETLNNEALKGTYDITKASAAVLSHISQKYTLLKSGAAFGLDGGPLLIAPFGKKLNEHSIIAIPGEHTSAHALFRRYYKKPCRKTFVLFSDIFQLLSSGQVDAGVIIHEDRFTFSQHGFECISDLGFEWKKETNLPVPLGIFLAKNTIQSNYIAVINEIIAESIVYAHSNYDKVFPWIREHARNEHPDIIRKHIEYYVNDLSFDMGEIGFSAIELLNSNLH